MKSFLNMQKPKAAGSTQNPIKKPYEQGVKHSTLMQGYQKQGEYLSKQIKANLANQDFMYSPQHRKMHDNLVATNNKLTENKLKPISGTGNLIKFHGAKFEKMDAVANKKAKILSVKKQGAVALNLIRSFM